MDDKHMGGLLAFVITAPIMVICCGGGGVILAAILGGIGGWLSGLGGIATVIAADLSRVAQAAPGTALRFRFVELEEALKARAAAARHRKALPDGVTPRIRDPHDIPDLLSYQLVGGVVSAKAEE